MTDYYSLISRLLTPAHRDDANARLDLYARARDVLRRYLAEDDPPLAESEQQKQMLLLEKAIERAEAEFSDNNLAAPAATRASAKHGAAPAAQTAGRQSEFDAPRAIDQRPTRASPKRHASSADAEIVNADADLLFGPHVTEAATTDGSSQRRWPAEIRAREARGWILGLVPERARIFLAFDIRPAPASPVALTADGAERLAADLVQRAKALRGKSQA